MQMTLKNQQLAFIKKEKDKMWMWSSWRILFIVGHCPPPLPCAPTAQNRGACDKITFLADFQLRLAFWQKQFLVAYFRTISFSSAKCVLLLLFRILCWDDKNVTFHQENLGATSMVFLFNLKAILIWSTRRSSCVIFSLFANRAHQRV